MEDPSVFFGRSERASVGARRVLQRAFRDGSIVPILSVAIILVIMVTMAVMLQVYLVRKITARSGGELSWKMFQPWHSAEQRYAGRRGASGIELFQADSDPLEIELDERSPEFPGKARYSMLGNSFYLGEQKSFCLFNSKNSGLSRHGVVYNLSSFPYHLCTHAIYSSAAIDSTNSLQGSNVEVDLLQNAFGKFPGLKAGNPFLRVFVGVDDDASLHRISQDAESLVNFTLKSLRWVLERRFNGIFLRWSPPLKEGASQFPALVSHMTNTFKRVHGLSVGVIVPLTSDGRDLYADVGHFLDVLEPYSILVDPLTAGSTGTGDGSSYFRSFFPYTTDSIAKYRDFFARTVETERSKYNYICYPVSIAGYSLALEDLAASSVGSRSRRSSPPTIAVSQLKSGLAVTPYDATCATTTDLRANVSIRLRFVVLSARESQWVAYQDKNSLVQLLDALRQVTGGAPCLGVWDPEWDDIAGHCSPQGAKREPYPLTKTIFTDRHRTS
ncbi:hypothetical protein HPB51_001684 [Rhipicephalus microplus]|uniref:Chitinase n=2 Tax=Rhipicephalus microplus TaxID=6941 RepID=A0A9J6EWD4_RHIMP|nr:hypothetical protein HPB51_001684 [Rhipicephalus microplus]